MGGKKQAGRDLLLGTSRLFCPFDFAGFGQKTEVNHDFLPLAPAFFRLFVCTLSDFDPLDQFKEQGRRQLVDILIPADDGSQAFLLLPQAVFVRIRLQSIHLRLQLRCLLLVFFQQGIEGGFSDPARYAILIELCHQTLRTLQLLVQALPLAFGFTSPLIQPQAEGALQVGDRVLIK